MDLSKQLIRSVINMYREREYLWRVNSEDYRKKDLRMRGYQEIVDYLKSQGVSKATDSLVRDKIQNMRRSARKEKSKTEQFKGYTTTLWYYDLLKCVLERDETVATTSKTKAIKMELEESNSDHNSNDPLHDDHYPNENDIQELDTTAILTKMEETPHPEVTYVRNPDEFEALGINVAAKVRRMDCTQKIYAELLIQKVLAWGLLGKLNNTTEISDTPNVIKFDSRRRVRRSVRS